jgi:hypothetical protein
MTKKQQEDFAKLELAYLDQVLEANPDGQIRQMEVIFFWLKKQIFEARLPIILNIPHKDGVPDYEGGPSPAITPDQKGQFTFLQMKMIRVACRTDPDRMGMRHVEKEMREWIDKQIAEAVNQLVKPKIKIIRDNGKN